MYILIETNSTLYIENFYNSNRFYTTIDVGKYCICFNLPLSIKKIISYKEYKDKKTYFAYYNDLFRLL